MSRFQACIGPSASKAHIFDTEGSSLLVLCERTTKVRVLKGAVAHSAICETCAGRMFRALGETVISAELIGVAEIV